MHSAGRTHQRSVAFLLTTLAASPASAAHCPPGQIYRVHLNECVVAQTSFARPYVHAPHRLHRPTRLRPPLTRHMAEMTPTPGPDPDPAPPPEPPAAVGALPELEAGDPAF